MVDANVITAALQSLSSAGVGATSAPAPPEGTDINAILQQLMSGSVDPNVIIQQLAATGVDIQGLIAQITGYRDETPTAYEEAKGIISDQYARAAERRTETYNPAMQEVTDSLGNLGLDYLNSDSGREWDSEQRTLTEVADIALANDLAWFDKMAEVDRSTYDAILAELARAVVLGGGLGTGVGGGSSGGGGSGGGSGGGGYGGGGSGSGNSDVTGAPGTIGLVDGSGESSTTTNDRYSQPYPFWDMQIQELLNMGDEDAQYWRNYDNLSKGDPNEVAKQITAALIEDEKTLAELGEAPTRPEAPKTQLLPASSQIHNRDGQFDEMAGMYQSPFTSKPARDPDTGEILTDANGNIKYVEVNNPITELARKAVDRQIRGDKNVAEYNAQLEDYETENQAWRDATDPLKVAIQRGYNAQDFIHPFISGMQLEESDMTDYARQKWKHVWIDENGEVQTDIPPPAVEMPQDIKPGTSPEERLGDYERYTADKMQLDPDIGSWRTGGRISRGAPLSLPEEDRDVIAGMDPLRANSYGNLNEAVAMDARLREAAANRMRQEAAAAAEAKAAAAYAQSEANAVLPSAGRLPNNNKPTPAAASSTPVTSTKSYNDLRRELDAKQQAVKASNPSRTYYGGR